MKDESLLIPKKLQSELKKQNQEQQRQQNLPVNGLVVFGTGKLLISNYSRCKRKNILTYTAEK